VFRLSPNEILCSLRYSRLKEKPQKAREIPIKLAEFDEEHIQQAFQIVLSISYILNP
jgi:hypothetical protein